MMAKNGILKPLDVEVDFIGGAMNTEKYAKKIPEERYLSLMELKRIRVIILTDWKNRENLLLKELENSNKKELIEIAKFALMEKVRLQESIIKMIHQGAKL